MNMNLKRKNSLHAPQLAITTVDPSKSSQVDVLTYLMQNQKSADWLQRRYIKGNCLNQKMILIEN